MVGWFACVVSSSRALRRMQRAVEDELAAQLQGMSLEDMSSRPPGGESAAHSERAPMPSQSSHELPAAGPRPHSRVAALQCVSSLPKRIVSLPSNQSQESHQIRCVPGSKSARSMNFPKTAHGDCVHLDSNCWGVTRNTPLTTRNLCRVCRDRHRTGL